MLSRSFGYRNITWIVPRQRLFFLRPISNMAQDWVSVSGPNIPTHDIYQLPIEKPEKDDRDYRLIRLQNGLHAMLIHDPKGDKAAAAMNVGVGHLSDPDDMPGLAHFCEHLLFMGSKQFPRENDYGEFIQKHGGQTNAYTAASYTNYYFSVGAAHLEGALQRFSGFFHSPMFDAGSTMRELKAVDSENKNNRENDVWRQFQLHKHLSRPGSVWSKFGTGDFNSLTAAAKQAQKRQQQLSVTPTGSLAPTPIPSRPASTTPSDSGLAEDDGGFVGRETRRRLIEWWEKHYCASHMHLAILGRESIEDLTRLALDNFSAVVNQSYVPDPNLSVLPWSSEEEATMILVKTVKDYRVLELSFCLPDQEAKYESKPSSLLAHFIGHEGPGSLHSYLKGQGWNTYLSAGLQVASDNFGFFKITIMLTKAGFEKWRSVLAATWAYLALLRSSELPEWHYSEYAALNEIAFRFSEKKPADRHVSKVSENMGRPGPRDRVLSARQRIWKYDLAEVKRMVCEDLHPEKVKILLGAQDWATTGFDNTAWIQEPRYTTEYQVLRLGATDVEMAQTPAKVPELHLPDPNEFIATKLDVEKIAVETPASAPTLLRDSPLSSLWHKKDDQFWVPKGSVSVVIESPVATITARHMAMTILYAALITDSLAEYSYDADLAGLRFTIAHHVRGIEINIAGYDEKLHTLLHHVLERARNILIASDRFAVVLELTKEQFRNFYLQQPISLGSFIGQHTLADVSWSPADQLIEMNTITVEETQSHISDFWRRVHFTTLVHGNFSSAAALEMQDGMEKLSHSKAISPQEISIRGHVLPNGCNYVYSRKVFNPKEMNSSVTYYCQIGEVGNDAIRIRKDFLDYMIREPAFDILRTKEQLGYIVYTSSIIIVNESGITINVQSEKNPIYVEKRIDAFLDHFLQYLKDLSEEEFLKHRTSFIAKLRERLESLKEEFSRFQAHTMSGFYDFERRSRTAVLVESLSKEDMITFFETFIHHSSPQRRKFSIHLQSQVEAVKFTVAASEAFLADLEAQGVQLGVGLAKYKEMAETEPSVLMVKGFFKQFMAAVKTIPSEAGEFLMKRIDELAALHPAQDEVEVRNAKLPDNAVIIEDLERFKRGLHLGKTALPVGQVFYKSSTASVAPKL